MRDNRYGGYNQQFEDSVIVKIAKELKANPKSCSEQLTMSDLYLPDGKAHKVANNLQKTNSNQVRKLFSMIKEAEHLAKTSEFSKAQEKLYMIIPMTAYAVGRELIHKDFYSLLETLISPSKIKTSKDIETFSKFFESIVAYLKK
ncbi:MAG TPA: type III-A CRISPR-associated protein Csm2 [Bacilli bacterium]|nr:type III-A CRISPR-associated protein Csm2 [Bacilli bacterium]